MTPPPDATCPPGGIPRSPEGNALFRAIFEYHDAIMLLVSPADGIIAEANLAAQRFYGYRRERLLGMRITEINTLPLADIKRYWHLALSGERNAFIHPHRMADGSERVVEVHSSPVDFDGDILLFSVIHDVTERVNAQKALAQSEAKYRILAENMLDLICLHDADGAYLYVSPSSQDILGAAPEDLLGTTPGKFIVPEDLPRVREAFAHFAQGSTASRDIAFRIRDAAGRPRWLESRLSPVRQTAMAGDRPGVISVTRDITHRKTITAALVREAHITRTMARLSQDMLGTRGLSDICRATREVAMFLTHSAQGLASPVDNAGVLTPRDMSIKVYGQFPSTSPDVPGERLVGLAELPPKLSRCVDQLVAVAEARERTLAPLHAATSPVNPDRAAEATCLATRAMVGDKTVGILAVADPDRPYSGKDRAVIDRLASIMALGISRGQLERQMVSAREDSETASRMKSEFLANMSHEIRTPLNGLLGMLQLLQDTCLDTEQNGFVETALRSGHRLTALLSDILDLARVEAGKLFLCQEPFALSEVFAAVADTFGPVCRERGLGLSLHMAPSLPQILLGDEVRVRQVVFNVVGNAVKFTRQGEIRMEAYPLPTPQAGTIRIFFTISDTGIGIPEEKIDTIFDSFTQADGAVTRKYEGAGLGLAIVRNLVELMDGHIVVETEPGDGTTLSFCLRLGLPDASSAVRPAPGPEDATAPTPSLRVLIVEDERINRMALRRMLEKMGHAVLEAENGRVALCVLSEKECDCILMDIQMPELGGLETLEILRHDPAYAHRAGIPVIALTAHAMIGDRERFLAAGMDGYLAKPIDVADLRRLLGTIRRA